jgi:hypothetical protein
MGLLIGSGFYTLSTGQVIFTPAPAEVMLLSKNTIGVIAIISTFLTFYQYWKHKSFFNTTTDGFITGFATIMDTIAIWLAFF